MPWIATSCDNLRFALAVGGHSIEMASATGTADLCALIESPPARHVVLELYTAQGNEQVIAYRCDGGTVTITRANGGTTQTNWPAGTCARTVQIVESPLCGAEDDTPVDGDKCNPCNWSPLAGLTVCPALVLDTSTAEAPTLCLTPTGVVAGDYCGMVVNEYGQITELPEDFPASCLPVFDPCACGPGSGGSTPTGSDDVTHSPQIGACVVAGPTVQAAINQLETQICGFLNGAGLVRSVSVCPALTATASQGDVAICLTPVGPGAGIYGTLELNAYGQVLNYVPPSGGGGGGGVLAVSGAAPVTVTPVGAGAYQIGISSATTTTYGAVTLALASEMLNNTESVDAVVSWGALQTWWTSTQGYFCSLTPQSGLSLTDATSIYVPICTSGGLRRTSLSEISAAVGGTIAAGEMVSFAPAASYNIVAASPISTIGWQITLAVASAYYHVNVTTYSTTPYFAVVEKLSGNQFNIRWYDTAGLLVGAPPNFSYTVTRIA